ncbi:MAG: hypothetical protein ACFFAO_22030 [Candidatus Hermodarchaeota archaeon]
MELFQIFWDDQKRLFLEFKKNEDEKQLFLPENIKRLNLQFEILKQEIFYKDPPYLISIKKLFHSKEALSFAIDLDLISPLENLQIKILRLVIFLYSGQRIEYSFEETFKMSEISINEDCYLGFETETLDPHKNQQGAFTPEKIYEEIKTEYTKYEQKRTVIYGKKGVGITSKDHSLISMISESNKSLKNIEEQLKNLAVILKSGSFTHQQYLPAPPVIKRSQEIGIERIKQPYSKDGLIQSGVSSAKILVIKEMKSVFKKSFEKNNGFNIKDILKPMSDEELKSITLDKEELKEKEEIAIKNQIKRIEEQNKSQVSLKNLKKPK